MSDNRRTMFESSYGEDAFFQKADRYDYTEIRCEILKNLKFNYESEGAYSRRVLVCRIEDNIDMIKKYCGSESKAEDYFHMCFPGIALFTRKIELTDEFRNKYQVKPWHISLMRRTYFDISIDGKGWSYTKSNAEIVLGDKRPYGNSDVLGDIAEEYFDYNRNKKITQDGHTFKWSDEEIDDEKVDLYDLKHEYMSKNADFFWNIMDETKDIIINGLKEIDLSGMVFVRNEDNNSPFNYYTEKWEVCKSVVRNKKIEKLIKDE